MDREEVEQVLLNYLLPLDLVTAIADDIMTTVSLPNNLDAAPTPMEETQEVTPMIDPLAPALSYLERMANFPGQNDSLDHLRAVCAALGSERAARERAEGALRKIGRYSKDGYVLGLVAEGLGGVNG